tara:strand:+ start:1422 stop:1616 length:195 start_codon:yes stop_codon:yes gene_type:complete
MIQIKQHSNFKEFFQVLNFGKLVDEFRGEAMAIKKASRIARKQNQFNIEIVRIKTNRTIQLKKV